MAYSALRSFSLRRQKSAATPVFASYHADITLLPPEMVLTRKQNDSVGDDTHVASWTEFCGEQSRREIVSPRIFFGKEITEQVPRIAFINMYICVFGRSLRVSFCTAPSHKMGKLDDGKAGL